MVAYQYVYVYVNTGETDWNLRSDNTGCTSPEVSCRVLTDQAECQGLLPFVLYMFLVITIPLIMLIQCVAVD